MQNNESNYNVISVNEINVNLDQEKETRKPLTLYQKIKLSIENIERRIDALVNNDSTNDRNSKLCQETTNQ